MYPVSFAILLRSKLLQFLRRKQTEAKLAMFAKRLGGGQSWENLLTQTKYSVAVLSKLKLTHIILINIQKAFKGI